MRARSGLSPRSYARCNLLLGPKTARCASRCSCDCGRTCRYKPAQRDEKTRRAMRSIWKGHIRFSLVTIPIRIYNAVDTEETIRFNQLHKEDNGAVGYDKKCKKCGKALTSEEIVKGYQFEPEQYVIISPEDV